ncbi:WhiB family transcriptional regulator [Schaalia sp. ZJ405]|nr:WhiB family transcriptional regulator [Schaalia sp. ZJ405]QPK81142.1 WhiB family transcriptional regulator [Schaalia sp. ZJ405]
MSFTQTNKKEWKGRGVNFTKLPPASVTDRALCATYVDSDRWFPTLAEKHQALEAIAICLQCPVRIQCRQWAIDSDEPFGIWGGLTPRARGFNSLGRHVSKNNPQEKGPENE